MKQKNNLAATTVAKASFPLLRRTLELAKFSNWERETVTIYPFNSSSYRQGAITTNYGKVSDMLKLITQCTLEIRVTSLRNCGFTICSNVTCFSLHFRWSFGILLWEIATFGNVWNKIRQLKTIKQIKETNKKNKTKHIHRLTLTWNWWKKFN